MPRRSRFEVVLDTSHFSPAGLHPRFMLANAMQGWVRWLREHMVSFRRLISEHSVGVVVCSGEAEWQEPLGFMDSDVIEAEAGVSAVKAGAMLAIDVDFSALGRKVGKVKALLRPVAISGDGSLGALSSRLKGDLLARFQPDEILGETAPRFARKLAAEAEESGAPLLESEQPLYVHRHMVEVADQWSFVETGAIAEAARENLCAQQVTTAPVAQRGMGAALRRFSIDLTRPLFVYDRAIIRTRAYAFPGPEDLIFVHRIVSSIGSGKPHAVLTEEVR
jgi:hypothetical protein